MGNVIFRNAGTEGGARPPEARSEKPRHDRIAGARDHSRRTRRGERNATGTHTAACCLRRQAYSVGRRNFKKAGNPKPRSPVPPVGHTLTAPLAP